MRPYRDCQAGIMDGSVGEGLPLTGWPFSEMFFGFLDFPFSAFSTVSYFPPSSNSSFSLLQSVSLSVVSLSAFARRPIFLAIDFLWPSRPFLSLALLLSLPCWRKEIPTPLVICLLFSLWTAIHDLWLANMWIFTFIFAQTFRLFVAQETVWITHWYIILRLANYF